MINKKDSVDSSKSNYVSVFSVPKMDCPSEERMIRMAMEDITPSVVLEFDTPNRTLKIFHENKLAAIKERIETLNYGAICESTNVINEDEHAEAKASAKKVDEQESAILIWLLIINASMFFIEFGVGWAAQSTGLIADSLDMFADASVYGVSLYAVGRTIKMKLHAAKLSGWLQIILAVGALSEVIRRFIYGSEPVSDLMMIFGCLALIANTFCLYLIAKNKDSGVHMKASWIFSANDVIANTGVIIAGVLVAVTGSRYPDLVIGLIIGIIVLNGARTILKLK